MIITLHARFNSNNRW